MLDVHAVLNIFNSSQLCKVFPVTHSFASRTDHCRRFTPPITPNPAQQDRVYSTLKMKLSQVCATSPSQQFSYSMISVPPHPVPHNPHPRPPPRSPAPQIPPSLTIPLPPPTPPPPILRRNLRHRLLLPIHHRPRRRRRLLAVPRRRNRPQQLLPAHIPERRGVRLQRCRTIPGVSCHE